MLQAQGTNSAEFDAEVERRAQTAHKQEIQENLEQAEALGWEKPLPHRTIEYWRKWAVSDLECSIHVKKFADKERKRLAGGGRRRRSVTIAQGR